MRTRRQLRREYGDLLDGPADAELEALVAELDAVLRRDLPAPIAVSLEAMLAQGGGAPSRRPSPPLVGWLPRPRWPSWPSASGGDSSRPPQRQTRLARGVSRVVGFAALGAFVVAVAFIVLTLSVLLPRMRPAGQSAVGEPGVGTPPTFPALAATVSASTPRVEQSVAPTPTPIPPTPTAAPLPRDTYPPAVPPAPGTSLDALSTTRCPDPRGIEAAGRMSPAALLRVFRALDSGERNTQRRATDASYWLHLDASPFRSWTVRPLFEEGLVEPQRAAQSPDAELIGRACGERTLARSWWAAVYADPHPEDAWTRSGAHAGHLYLVRRDGRWLVWGSRVVWEDRTGGE